MNNQKCNFFWIEVREHQVFFFFSMKTVDLRKTCLDMFRILLHAYHLYWLLLLDLNRDDTWGQLMYFEAVKHRMWIKEEINKLSFMTGATLVAPFFSFVLTSVHHVHPLLDQSLFYIAYNLCLGILYIFFTMFNIRHIYELYFSHC